MSEPPSETTTGGAVRTGLHQPARAAVAGGELLVLVGCALFARWLWLRGIVPVPVAESVSVPRLLGNWLVASVVVGTLGGLLLVDMLRQLTLALRVRR